MEQRTNQKPEMTVVQQRPVTVPANLNGDFAAGLRTMPGPRRGPIMLAARSLMRPLSRAQTLRGVNAHYR